MFYIAVAVIAIIRGIIGLATHKLTDLTDSKKYTDASVRAAVPFISTGDFIVGIGFACAALGSMIPTLTFLKNELIDVAVAVAVAVPFIVVGYKKLIKK